jgi:hypothetical protein
MVPDKTHVPINIPMANKSIMVGSALEILSTIVVIISFHVKPMYRACEITIMDDNKNTTSKDSAVCSKKNGLTIKP